MCGFELEKSVLFFDKKKLSTYMKRHIYKTKLVIAYIPRLFLSPEKYNLEIEVHESGRIEFQVYGN